MKKLLFIFLFLFFVEPVFANDHLQFYNTLERVEDMWITRVEGDEFRSDNPYVLRRKSDNTYVYCLQPFVLLNQKEDYIAFDSNQDILKLSDDDWERITNLAYFGYYYPGHEDKKWYGITQYLIWKTVAKNTDIYFSDGKNGRRIEVYEKEIKEIEELIENYQELKQLNNQKLIFQNSNEWNHWVKKNILLSNSSLLKSNNYCFKLPVNESIFGNTIIYYHKSGQNVYHPGELSTMSLSLEVEFLKGRIRLQKKNKEDVFVSSENILKGATYGIYQNGILIETMVTDEFGFATSSLLEYGIYTIKELSASPGYLIDQEFHTISIDQEEVPVVVYEDQEEKEITIEKWYGSGTYRLEENAVFEIYQGETLVLQVKTNSLGIANFKLPYGNYRLHQVKGKVGYQNIKDLEFTVDKDFGGKLKLFNKEIIEEVPNTGFLFHFPIVSVLNRILGRFYVI